MQRDLGSPDVWEQSLERSRARRTASAPRSGRPAEIGGRSVPLAAVLLAAGGSVAGVAAASAVGGSDQGTGTGATGARTAEVVDGARATAKPEKPGVPQPKPAAPSSSTATSRGGSTEIPALPRRQGAEASAETVELPVAASLRPKVTRASKRRVTTNTKTAAPKRRGGGVRALQAALGLSSDGDFGPATEKALRRWQRERGLSVDGVAGPRTLAALKLRSGRVLKRERPAKRRRRRSRTAKPRTRARSARSARSARRARRGGGVRALQAALGLSPDGAFGPATEKALRRFQKSKGLPVDGVAGPATRRALRLGPGKTLKRSRPQRRRRSGGGGGGAGGSSTVARVLAAANRIASKPYRYGGGHGSFNDSAYDCSGSVSYALHGGGLLSAPMASGAFRSYGAPGPGKHITIYATSGHMYMTINGRRFDTSARRQSGSRWGGPRQTGGGYVVRHPPGL